MSAVSDAAAIVERPPPRVRGWPRSRILGYCFVGFWILFGLGILGYLVSAWNSEDRSAWTSVASSTRSHTAGIA